MFYMIKKKGFHQNETLFFIALQSRQNFFLKDQE